MFDPELIILAGSLPMLGDSFLGRLKEALKKFPFLSNGPRVVYSALGEFNGALGAAALAVHEWKPSEA